MTQSARYGRWRRRTAYAAMGAGRSRWLASSRDTWRLWEDRGTTRLPTPRTMDRSPLRSTLCTETEQADARFSHAGTSRVMGWRQLDGGVWLPFSFARGTRHGARCWASGRGLVHAVAFPDTLRWYGGYQLTAIRSQDLAVQHPWLALAAEVVRIQDRARL